MGWKIVGLGGGSGAGFQLFKKTTDGLDAIFADAAARDAYFGANPADLALLDADQFLIIKLLDNGVGEVAYQQRQLGTWVDVTSLVQGEQGPAGATGNSYFFASIADRDAFFSTPPNEGLLENGLPVSVNVGDETLSNFIWNGVSGPVTYDPDDWVIASIQVSSGTVFLGQAGASLSSGNEVVGFKTAGGTKRYLIGVQYQDIGSSHPVYWELASLSTVLLSTLFTQTLSDPQSVQYQFPDDQMLIHFTLRPATVGELRIEMWLGVDDTGPQLVSAFFPVTAPDVGNPIVYTLPNDSLMTSLTDVYITFSGVQLFGDLQTSGPFNTQTVPTIAVGVQAGNQLNFVSSQAISGLAAGQVVYGDGDNSLESESALFWDSTGKNLGVNQAIPDTTLHANSGAANTKAVSKLENAVGFIQEFITGASPEGVITAGFGARATDLTTGDIWVKESASGNTGWIDLVTSSGAGDVIGPASSVDDELVLFDGVTGKLVQGGSLITATQGNSASINLGTTSTIDYPVINFLDNLDAVVGSLTFEVDGPDLIIDSIGGAGIQGVDSVYAYSETSSVELFGFFGCILSTFGAGDSNFAFAAQSNGAFGTNTPYYVGARNPDGNILAQHSAIYTSREGSNSNIYQLEVAGGGSANTPWYPLVKNIDGAELPAGLIPFGATNNKLDTDTAFIWADTGKNLGVNQAIPDTTLHVNSNGLNTEAISKLANTAGFYETFRVDATPEGVVTAPIGATANDTTGGNFYYKATGVGNTGWVALGGGGGSGDVVGPASATDGGLAIYDGVTGKLLKADVDIVWDTATNRLGVNDPSPDATLHVNSQAAATVSVTKLESTAGSYETFVTNTTPEGAITAPVGSIANDTTLGNLYYKRLGVGNLGWRLINSGSGGGAFTWGNFTIYTQTGLRYLDPGFANTSGAGTVALNFRSPITGILNNLGIVHNIPTTGGNFTIDYTVYINGAPSALTAAVLNTAVLGGDYITQQVIVSGDLISLGVNKPVTLDQAPGNVMASVQLITI